MNYRALYDWGLFALQEAQIEEAKLDARLLLEEACGTDRGFLLAHGGEPVSEEQEAVYRRYIEKRKNHIPLQHITGFQEFMGLRFAVNPHVLIPRQDTETLVEEVMLFLHDRMHILDLCTGSGCILLSLLRYSNDCVGVGADISEKALETARLNGESLGIGASFVQSDLFESIQGKFEIIVSNPPYIETEAIAALMEEVREHEPRLALDGKEDGLYFYRRIIREGAAYLYPGGMLFFEIGCDQGQAVAGLMKEAGYREVTVRQDLAGLDRVVYGTYMG